MTIKSRKCQCIYGTIGGIICANTNLSLMDKMLEILKDVKMKGFSENEQDVVDYNSKYVGCVDGAFNVKKSIAGYGWIIYNNKGEIIEKDSGKVDNPEGSMFKNVASELIGTIRLVEHAIKLNLGENLVVFDYYGIQKYFDGEWMTREGFTKNYVMRMKELNKSILIKMKKVYSHTGVMGNEVADRLAKIGAGFENVGDNVNKEEIMKDAKSKKPQAKVDYLKDCWKTIYKFLTLVEMTYLNNNLNNLNMDLLLLNFKVKAVNIDLLLEKNFNLFRLIDHEDLIEDNMM